MPKISGDTENGFGKYRYTAKSEYEWQWKGGSWHGRGTKSEYEGNNSTAATTMMTSTQERPRRLHVRRHGFVVGAVARLEPQRP